MLVLQYACSAPELRARQTDAQYGDKTSRCQILDSLNAVEADGLVASCKVEAYRRSLLAPPAGVRRDCDAP